jgi:hypothetical protein
MRSTQSIRARDTQPIRWYPLTSFRKLIESKGDAFFRAHVRHVAFQWDEWEQIISILSVCDATTSLALDTWDLTRPPSTFLPLLASIQPQRLSLYLPNLFPELMPTEFNHPLFSHLTHLTILDSTQASWSGVAHIPRLTHLAWPNRCASNALCQCALKDCKLLEALLVMCWARKWLERAVSARAELGVDPRFVMVVVQNNQADWETGARDGEDKWVRADEHVRRRRAGEVTSEY